MFVCCLFVGSVSCDLLWTSGGGQPRGRLLAAPKAERAYPGVVIGAHTTIQPNQGIDSIKKNTQGYTRNDVYHTLRDKQQHYTLFYDSRQHIAQTAAVSWTAAERKIILTTTYCCTTVVVAISREGQMRQSHNRACVCVCLPWSTGGGAGPSQPGQAVRGRAQRTHPCRH